MNRFFRILSLTLAAMIIIAALPVALPSALAESDGMVRVKLTRLGSPSTLVFTTNCAYYINNSSADKIPSGATVTVTLSGGSFNLKAGSINRSLGVSFTLNRKKGGVGGAKFTTPAVANVFTGDFTFTKASGKIVTIMTTYVEDYLYGVVGYEMSNSYPIEALKAQAISARNYVMRAKASRAARDYDVTDTTADQVYKGYNASYANVIKAVDQTRGQLLYYGSALAACYYGASNGGQTESTKNAWGSNLAYSVVKDDPYDLESGATSRSVTFKKDQTGETMNKKLRKAIIDAISGTLSEYDCSTAEEDITINKIVSIEPMTPKYAAPSRLYTQLKFTVKVTTMNENGEPVTGKAEAVIPTYGNFETWFNLSINSGDNEVIWVDSSDDTITVTFRRWGHGIGMSQRGARVMAEKYTMDHGSILDFYYPGTEIRYVSLKDTTGHRIDGGGDDPGDEWGEPIGRAEVRLESATSTLSMRKEASKDSDVVVRLNHGTILDVYGFSGDWTKVSYENSRGYVKSKYLKALDDSEPTPELTLAPTPTPDPGDDDAQYAKIKLSNPKSSLKVRKKATTSSRVVCLVKHGKIVKILAVKNNWVKIQLPNGKKGFVMKKYLKKVKNASGAEIEETGADIEEAGSGDIAAQLREDQFLLAKASTDAPTISGISAGEEVIVLAYSDEWAYIAYGGMEGFVPTASLRRVDK